MKGVMKMEGTKNRLNGKQLYSRSGGSLPKILTPKLLIIGLIWTFTQISRNSKRNGFMILTAKKLFIKLVLSIYIVLSLPDFVTRCCSLQRYK